MKKKLLLLTAFLFSQCSFMLPMEDIERETLKLNLSVQAENNIRAASLLQSLCTANLVLRLLSSEDLSNQTFYCPHINPEKKEELFFSGNAAAMIIIDAQSEALEKALSGETGPYPEFSEFSHECKEYAYSSDLLTLMELKYCAATDFEKQTKLMKALQNQDMGEITSVCSILQAQLRKRKNRCIGKDFHLLPAEKLAKEKKKILQNNHFRKLILTK